MSWTDNQIILNQRPTMASRDLFQAVCDEIAKHYETKGFKYSRSKAVITYHDDEIRLVVGFSSSRSNTAGSHITLEILPAIYSLEIIRQNKSTITSTIAKGLILSHIDFFTHKNSSKTDKKIVRQIYGDVVELEPMSAFDAGIRDNHYCNIWGIDENKFAKILAFIDGKIIPMIDVVKNEDEIIKFIEDKPSYLYASLKGQGVNSDFVSYCNLKFPGLKIEERLSR
ncbi:MAG: hypothetical protein HYZ44_14580 [Bacteroidetes bacterium]|nr:hypothetical protein [Bacteroidota bacterium]